MIGDPLTDPRRNTSLELADADTGVLILSRNAAVRKLATPTSFGEHP
jgi:hypothetical protein